MFRFVKKLWRRHTNREIFQEEGNRGLCSELRLLGQYGNTDCIRLLELVEDFLATKTIEGADGLNVTSYMCRVIAAQACVPILNLGLEYYDGWYTVVLYPGEFRVPHEYIDAAGVVHLASRDLSGEAWHRGPVILSWEQVEEDARGVHPGENVVIHEFAHKLDLLNGQANGMPPLHSGVNRNEWTEVFTAAFDDFHGRIELGWTRPMSAYGATSPGEFFAVSSEAFFAKPEHLSAVYPEIYRMLSQFYRQNPLHAG